MLSSQLIMAHGGVGMEGGQCLIRIGNLEARFTGYQPATRGSKEFCDDLPDLTGSIFVLDFVHDVLNTMPLDFRIIRDENNFGLSASSDDIKSLNNIDELTEYYSPPTRYDDGNVEVRYEFLNPGIYIGIITAQHPSSGVVYEAVFPFRVGAINYLDYWWVFIVVMVGLQFLFRRTSVNKVSSRAVDYEGDGDEVLGGS
ncbi:MAG: hypothetical protein COB51_08545 [Moraxellaceae bacterium]|nr:MAG: hypothetical protein COB51_08545 [Moraxellaceae bacterium]